MVECVLYIKVNGHNKGMRCLMNACNKSRSALIFIQEACIKSSFYSARRFHSDTIVWLDQSHPNCIYRDVAETTNCVYGTLHADIYFCARRVHNMHLQLHAVHQDVPMYACTC